MYENKKEERMWMRVCVLYVCVCLFGVVGCGNPDAAMSLEGYRKTCTEASDCMLAVEGGVCGICGPCATQAIAKSEKARYDKEYEEVAATCPPDNSGAVCAACEGPGVVCTDGVCGTKPRQ